MTLYRESPESLIEVFGTPHPSRSTINRWKLSWREERGRIQVNNYNGALKFLKENEVDPLFYQTYAEGNSWEEKFYIVFYREEDETFFKIHNGFI